MKRYVTLDFLRGLSIFGMIFFHLLNDIYDMSWTSTSAGLQSAPLFNIILLILGLFFGSWAGLFLMVSAASNMVSMHNNFENGKSVRSVVLKQVLGGFILLLFGFLAEGTLQYYAVFQTFRNGSTTFPTALLFNGTPDFSRILWKGFTMETIHTIAWCMIVNGIVQGLLSLNGGHSKINRNIIIYVILAIVVVIVTQPIWNVIYNSFGGYPFATDLSHVSLTGVGLDAERPYLNNAADFILKFFLLPLAGIPEPIFPFLAVSFIGSIFGLLLCQKPVSRSWPKKGIWAGLLIIVSGVIVGIILDLPFGSFLPFSSFSDFRGIEANLPQGYGWIPWVSFITGGQVIAMCMMFRLVEFRGNSANFAQKTSFIRRFGMVPFTLYTFHRMLAMIPMILLSYIFSVNMTVDSKDLDGWTSLAVIGISILFIYGVLRLWEKKDYIGSLEWMIGTISAYLLGVPKKSKEKVRWYRWGARDQKEIFYNVAWIDVFEKGDNGGDECRNSKLAFKFAIAGALGLIAFPATLIGLGLEKSSEKLEGKNKYNRRARITVFIAIAVNVAVIIVCYLLTLGMLGISL